MAVMAVVASWDVLMPFGVSRAETGWCGLLVEWVVDGACGCVWPSSSLLSYAARFCIAAAVAECKDGSRVLCCAVYQKMADFLGKLVLP